MADRRKQSSCKISLMYSTTFAREVRDGKLEPMPRWNAQFARKQAEKPFQLVRPAFYGRVIIDSGSTTWRTLHCFLVAAIPPPCARASDRN